MASLLIVVGRNIRRTRNKLHFTQSFVAKQAQVSLTYYGDIERGTANPSLIICENIAKALGVHPNVILCDEADNQLRMREALMVNVQHILRIFELMGFPSSPSEDVSAAVAETSVTGLGAAAGE